MRLLEKDPVAAKRFYGEMMVVHPGIQHNLGMCFQLEHDYENALHIFKALCDKQPDYVRPYLGAANCHRHMGNLDEAICVLETAKSVDRAFPQTYFLLSALYVMANEMDLAAKASVTGLVKSALAEAQETENFAQCYYENFNGSVYTKRAGSATLLDYLYTECFDSETLCQLHKAYDVNSQSSFIGQKPAGDCIRVGFMSENLAYNATTGFTWALLGHPPGFQTYFYHTGVIEDDVTRAIAARADYFRDCSKNSVASVMDVVQKDELHVLISLDGHTGTGATLTIMASKLAPIQMDYLGYPATTGRASIDYKIADEETNPPDSDEAYAEEVLVMPAPFLCWAPVLPNARLARVPIHRPATEGKLRILAPHNFKKLSMTTVELYKGVLAANPDVELHLKSSLHAVPTAVQTFFDRRFEEYKSRVHLVEYVDDTQDNLDYMATFDLVLDTFPYNGTTTTVECLFCGLPVITLAGTTHRSRVSASILKAVGHPELVAHTRDEYVQKATALLRDRVALHRLHTTLSNDLQSSPLMDAPEFQARFFDAVKSVCGTSNLSSVNKR